MRHFTLWAGDDVTLSATATDSAGAAVNLTGSTLSWTLSDGNVARVTKTTSDGITVTSAANGTFTVSLDTADTSDLEAGTYRHRATVTDASSNITTVLDGRARVLRDTAAPGWLWDYTD
jgi:hypothetical protein